MKQVTGCEPDPARQQQLYEIDPNLKTCRELHNSESQVQVVLTALDAYCGGPDFSNNKGNCTPPVDKTRKSELAHKLKQALDSLNHNIGIARVLCQRDFNPMI